MQEVTEWRTGKHRCYAHSRLVVAELRRNYTQLPRAVCSLDADDVPLGLGIAAVARRGMVACLKSDGEPIEAEIGEWLDACGVDAKRRSRDEGLAFWPSVADRLARVAEAGKLGTMKIVGQGREAVLSLNVEKALSTPPRKSVPGTSI